MIKMINEVLQYPGVALGLIMTMLFVMGISAVLANKGLISFKTFLFGVAVILIPFFIAAIT